jgi:hypothetical protein
LSPTTNFLDSGERADLIRNLKTRKLARVFGKTPGVDDLLVPDSYHEGPSLDGQHATAIAVEMATISRPGGLGMRTSGNGRLYI